MTNKSPQRSGQPNPVWRGNSLGQIITTAVPAFVLLAVGIYILTVNGSFVGWVLLLIAVAAMSAALVGLVRYRRLRS